MTMPYPVVPFTDEFGLEILAYRVDLGNGLIVLIPKAKIDSGETTLEAEIDSFRKSIQP